MKLLTFSNPKTLKGQKKGWRTAILHLSPAEESLAHGGLKTCPYSTPGCREACLNTAGRGGIPDKKSFPFRNRIHRARVQRTIFFRKERHLFLTQLYREIEREARKGGKLAIRLNGTSDLAWERIEHEGASMMDHFPEVTFYDYTKNFTRACAKRYDLTFSRGESTPNTIVKGLLGKEVNVAVVFDNVPKKWLGVPVINGDETDLRFLDPKGVIVGLKAKGRAKADTTGFVVRV